MVQRSIETLRDVRVLVTGAGGFIGSHLTNRLINGGAKVSVIDIARTDNLKDIINKVDFYKTDIRDFESVRKVVKIIQPEKIYHLGALIDARSSFLNVEKVFQTNVQGSINLIRSLENVDYDCFVNTGACEEYGDNPVPFTEEQVPNPTSPYSASKTSITLFCKMCYKSYNFPMITLRPTIAYGPCQSPKMFIPELICSALLKQDFKMSKGEQTRDFVYVEDVVDAYIKASTKKNAIGEIINIGSKKEYTMKDVVFKVLNLMGNPIAPLIGALPYRPREIMRYCCDNSKAKAILDWVPKTDLDDGLKKTINWYVSNDRYKL